MFLKLLHDYIDRNYDKISAQFSVNLCTASVGVNNSASVTFFPPMELQTGTVDIVFCLPGYLPPSSYGTMICDGNGLWQNAPTCMEEETTTQETTTTAPTMSDMTPTMSEQTTNLIPREDTTEFSSTGTEVHSTPISALLQSPTSTIVDLIGPSTMTTTTMTIDYGKLSRFSIILETK